MKTRTFQFKRTILRNTDAIISAQVEMATTECRTHTRTRPELVLDAELLIQQAVGKVREGRALLLVEFHAPSFLFVGILLAPFVLPRRFVCASEIVFWFDLVDLRRRHRTAFVDVFLCDDVVAAFVVG